MEVPRIPLNINNDSYRSFDEYMAKPKLIGGDEADSAAFDLALEETGVSLLAKLDSVSNAEGTGVSKITAEEANNRYPGMPTPFREDVNPYVAQMQYDELQRKQELADKIARGPQDWWAKTKYFGAGILAHMMDPLELGAGMITGWGVGAAVSRGMLGKTIATAAQATTAGTRLGMATLESATGNVIENVAQEGLIAATQEKMGGEYNPEVSDVLTNIAISSFAGTAVNIGVKVGAHGLGRILSQTSPEADLAVGRAVIGNMMDNKRPDVVPFLRALQQETAVNPKDFGMPEYKFEPLQSLEGKRLYVSTRDASADFRAGNGANLGDDFGMGTHITDNPGVANAAASRAMSDSAGSVHEVALSEINPVKLGEAIPENLHGIMVDELGFPPEMTMREALTFVREGVDSGDLPANTIDRLKGEFQEKGYDSLLSDGSKFLGEAHPQHNHITLFDDSKLSQKATFKPDPAIVKSPSPEDIKAMADRASDYKSHILFDEKTHTEVVEQIKRADNPEVLNSANMKKSMDESIEGYKQMEELGLLNAQERAQLETIVKEFGEVEMHNRVLNAAQVCVGA